MIGVTESVAWLEGGIARWMILEFPVSELAVPAIPAIENAQPSGEGMPV